MNNAITFTAHELWTMVLAICGGIVAVSGAITALSKLHNKMREPETHQDDRIAKCEARLDDIDEILIKYDGFFQRDKMRLDRLEFGKEAENKALLALLNHALYKDNEDELKDAKKELEQYLVSTSKVAISGRESAA